MGGVRDQKEAELGEATRWAYALDCGNGSGTYEQQVYNDAQGGGGGGGNSAGIAVATGTRDVFLSEPNIPK